MCHHFKYKICLFAYGRLFTCIIVEIRIVNRWKGRQINSMLSLCDKSKNLHQ